MIEPLTTGKVRCLSCGNEWTPIEEGRIPQRCGVCGGCAHCGSIVTRSGHLCQQRRMAV